MKWLAALILAWCACWQGVAVDAEAKKAAWREALALELPREVLAEGESLVAPSGALASDGEAIALVARALQSARRDGLAAAAALLAKAHPTPASADFVELERVRLAIESDELARALMAILPNPEAREPRFASRAEAWLYAGRAWVRSGNSARAAPFLVRFVELAPRDRETPSALHLLAQEALARGDGAAAQKMVARAEELSRWHALWKVRTTQIREQPEEPLPRLGLAQLYLQSGEPARAKTVLETLCAMHPEFAQGWFHLGEAERLLNQLPRASELYTKTISLDEHHVLARNNRGMIARLEGRLDDARADFEAIVDGPRAEEKNALSSHLNLARCLVALGRTQDAQSRYERYVRLGGREPLAPAQR